jgi:hypothetical protein
MTSEGKKREKVHFTKVTTEQVNDTFKECKGILSRFRKDGRGKRARRKEGQRVEG